MGAHIVGVYFDVDCNVLDTLLMHITSTLGTNDCWRKKTCICVVIQMRICSCLFVCLCVCVFVTVCFSVLCLFVCSCLTASVTCTATKTCTVHTTTSMRATVSLTAINREGTKLC